jgi:hypothetical protein
MKVEERRERVLNILRRRNRYQFGQPPHTCSLVRRSGCSDTSIQMIVLMAKGKSVSLNDVRRRSGAPASAPMTVAQALRALRSYGLRYTARSDLGALGVMRVARLKGPVIVCERYWAHPQWIGSEYARKTLSGFSRNDNGSLIRVGAARPLRHAGLTQWTFRGGHAVLVATDDWIGKEHVAIVRDPNHNSPSRPERPAYDIVSVGQLNRMLGSWGNGRLVLAPINTVIK